MLLEMVMMAVDSPHTSRGLSDRMSSCVPASVRCSRLRESSMRSASPSSTEAFSKLPVTCMLKAAYMRICASACGDSWKSALKSASAAFTERCVSAAMWNRRVMSGTGSHSSAQKDSCFAAARCTSRRASAACFSKATRDIADTATPPPRFWMESFSSARRVWKMVKATSSEGEQRAACSRCDICRCRLPATCAYARDANRCAKALRSKRVVALRYTSTMASARSCVMRPSRPPCSSAGAAAVAAAPAVAVAPAPSASPPPPPPPPPPAENSMRACAAVPRAASTRKCSDTKKGWPCSASLIM
jgi:hypothetical protein